MEVDEPPLAEAGAGAGAGSPASQAASLEAAAGEEEAGGADRGAAGWQGWPGEEEGMYVDPDASQVRAVHALALPIAC